MTVDWDGKIRMDCSSPYAMARPDRPEGPLRRRLRQRHRRRPPRHRHAQRGPAEPEPLSGAWPSHYLFAQPARAGARDGRRRQDAGQQQHDRPRGARRSAAALVEVPVGFKWFVDGLLDGSLGFGGEESAGASFLRRDGTVWTTDKDGIILGLLAAEITAQHRAAIPASSTATLTREFGEPVYERIDAPATPEQKAVAGSAVAASRCTRRELAGEPIAAMLTAAPGNGAPIGGAQGRRRERLVRRPAVGHRGRLQDLRRELPRTGALRRIQEDAGTILRRGLRGGGALTRPHGAAARTLLAPRRRAGHRAARRAGARSALHLGALRRRALGPARPRAVGADAQPVGGAADGRARPGWKRRCATARSGSGSRRSSATAARGLAAPAWFQRTHPQAPLTCVAYFSMEFGLSEALPHLLPAASATSPATT